MANPKNNSLVPYKAAAFAAVGLYLWKLSKHNASASLGSFARETKVRIDTDKLTSTIMPWVPMPPRYADVGREAIKKSLDILLEGVKK